MLDQLHNENTMTHMPFLANDADGQTVLYFCTSRDNSPWKIHYQTPEGEIRRLQTGLAEELCECATTAWRDDSGWHISFISGGVKEDSLYRLYRMDGPTLVQLSTPVAIHPTRAGFIYRDRLVHADVENLVYIHEPKGDKILELPGAFIYRVSYRSDEPQKMLVSGGWQSQSDNGEVFTIEFDLDSGQQNMVICDGKPAYKCAILGDRVIYADRIGEHFEARQLQESNITDRQPTNLAVLRLHGQIDPFMTQPLGQACTCKTSFGPIGSMVLTRPSCLECCEKHLGAAYVLLTESKDGYAYRLRVVGHLYEAEDETQAWPKLHDAIRSARKVFQTEGKMPDWPALEALIREFKSE